MLRHCIAFVVCVALCACWARAAEPNEFAATDWPWWRGPNRDGIAAVDQKPPLKWSQEKNVVWKAAVPGRGHGSPTIVGDHIYLATADLKTQSLLCYDRATGKRLWRTIVHTGGIAQKANKKASQASSSVACDGQRLYITFLNSNAIFATALSRDGEKLWQTKVSDYKLHQGYGSSPAIYKSLVIVSADNKLGGAIAGLDRASGEIVWKQKRPKLPNYSSPSIQEVDGRTQLIFTGCKLVSSFDPETGKKLWEIPGATEECVTTTGTDGKHVFSSGGYPRNHIAAIRADGSGKIVWQNTTRVYVPSMLVKGGYLYAVADAGVAMCFDSSTGKEMWKSRLGGVFSSSPVLVGENIFVTNETGTTFIYKATPDAFQLVGKNQLNAQVFPTPTFAGNRIYMRLAMQAAGERQEMLFCFGE